MINGPKITFEQQSLAHEPNFGNVNIFLFVSSSMCLSEGDNWNNY